MLCPLGLFKLGQGVNGGLGGISGMSSTLKNPREYSRHLGIPDGYGALGLPGQQQA